MNKLSKAFAFIIISTCAYCLISCHIDSSAAKESPVVLFASYSSGAGGGSWLTFRADSTYQFTDANLVSETVTSGRYTLTDSIITLDRLPTTGLLKSNKLLVRYIPNHDSAHTGNMVWQTTKLGKADSTLVAFTGYPYRDYKDVK
ncbi:MAG: hypothetical protein EOO61_12795 [Hymenobacter sp.]|nr:MAG: hypothetical protein EOO61_12795 [Hymenobacter sp.]